MSVRISTSGVHNAAIANMMRQQTQLSKTQQQLASGLRFQTPADDPIAAAQVLDFERTQSELDQYGKNSQLLTTRLSAGEQSMASIESLLQRVRDLVIQANGGGGDALARGAIATEIRARSQELMEIANRRDSSGEYLFAGYSTGTQPFARTATGVAYQADQGVRTLQVGTDQKIADGFSGSQVFMSIPEGNGTFTTAQGVHTGTGTIDTGALVNASAWVRDTYTISFTATGYEVRNSASALVTSGAYTEGTAIQFNGVSVNVSGEPALGDTFTVAPAATESIFDTLDGLATMLTSLNDDPRSKSTLATSMSGSLQQIDQ
ncbi:MAG: flagellar hook-associated protein FlgL, partial [Steroidobacteraceae bacterium]